MFIQRSVYHTPLVTVCKVLKCLISFKNMRPENIVSRKSRPKQTLITPFIINSCARNYTFALFFEKMTTSIKDYLLFHVKSNSIVSFKKAKLNISRQLRMHQQLNYESRGNVKRVSENFHSWIIFDFVHSCLSHTECTLP